MSPDDEIAQADRQDGAPHPRDAGPMVAQTNAVRGLLDAFRAGRLHHAWLITGPKGIGKATLAWKIATFLLAHPAQSPDGLFAAQEAAVDAPMPENLETDPDLPLVHRIAAGSEQALSVLRRNIDEKSGKLKTIIGVEDVRKLKRAFTMSLPDGGRRVVIVDSADEMNSSAANALLKLLEEPPADTIFLLLSHMPSRLLPTIRSRCRTLPCQALDAASVSLIMRRIDPALSESDADALAELAAGSVARAVRLHRLDGPGLQDDLDKLLASMPGLDRSRALNLASGLSARGSDERRDLFLQLIDSRLCDLARAGVASVTEPALPAALQRLAPTPDAGRIWAEAQPDLTGRVRNGLALNLDPHSLILDMVRRIDETAGRCAASQVQIP